MFWSILRQRFFFLYCYHRVCLMALVLSQKCEKVSAVDRMHNISDERFQNITLYRNQFWCQSEFSVPQVLSRAESIHSTCNKLRESDRCLALCYFDIYCPCLHNLSQWSDILNVTIDNWDHWVSNLALIDILSSLLLLGPMSICMLFLKSYFLFLRHWFETITRPGSAIFFRRCYIILYYEVSYTMD